MNVQAMVSGGVDDRPVTLAACAAGTRRFRRGGPTCEFNANGWRLEAWP